LRSSLSSRPLLERFGVEYGGRELGGELASEALLLDEKRCDP
jgi:hypothetical protein